MKILSAEQVRALDAYTIEHEPIASIDLMERASHRFTEWFCRQYPAKDRPIVAIAGMGNNGGDALAVARLLSEYNYPVRVIWCRLGETPSEDCATNRERLLAHPEVEVRTLKQGDPLPDPPRRAIIIDGLFGSGLNRPVTGYWAGLLEHLNAADADRVAIDIPSGVFPDTFTGGASFHAHHTLSFQLPKRAFFFPENEPRVGRCHIADIGLDAGFLETLDTPFHYLNAALARSLLRPRRKYEHKGSYGHALLMVGSLGSVGAAILAGRACYRSGAGLVTIHSPRCAYDILQISLPEAMVSLDCHKYHLSEVPDLDRYAAVGVGCGIGQRMTTTKAVRDLLEAREQPLVIDADALNIIAREPDLLDRIPPQSILTPHPKEFERLFGKTDNSFAANDLQREKAQALQCVIVLKRAHTAIALPNGNCYYNATGNPGMGTGGSGDVLTGMLTGLLAQGYDAPSAALLGVYLHGLAGDLAAESLDQEALLAGDIVEHLGKAYRALKKSEK